MKKKQEDESWAETDQEKQKSKTRGMCCYFNTLKTAHLSTKSRLCGRGREILETTILVGSVQNYYIWMLQNYSWHYVRMTPVLVECQGFVRVLLLYLVFFVLVPALVKFLACAQFCLCLNSYAFFTFIFCLFHFCSALFANLWGCL